MTLKIKGRTICLLVAGVGMGLTVWLTARNTPEALKRKEEALEKKRETTGDENAKLTFVESAQAQVGAYAPAIVSGMAVIGSLVGSEVINKENIKKAERAFDEYKDMTEKLSGKGSSKIIEKAVEQKKTDEKNGRPWEKKEQFRIVFQGKVITFEETRSNVINAIYAANRNFHVNGILTFNQFLECLEQPPVDEGDERGWECYIGESVYGYTWIDFGMKECEDEPWVTEIFMAVYPHFFDEDDCNSEIEEGCKKLGTNTFRDLHESPIPVEVKLEDRRAKKAE